MDNKLQIVKESFFCRIINFFKNKFFFKKQISENTEKIEESIKEEKIDNNICKVDIQRYDEQSIKLQEKFENENYSFENMSDEEVHALNKLYKLQIEELKQKIYYKKTELNRLRFQNKKSMI